MTGTNCDLFTHNQSQSYLKHLVFMKILDKLIALRSQLVCLIKTEKCERDDFISFKEEKGISGNEQFCKGCRYLVFREYFS